MSYNGSGTFQINTSGQPVVTGTSISSTVFNALTADLATGLSTAITKDGQTTTTARIPFALGINSTLVTDATNTTSGSIITAGGVGIAKALYVGTTANVAGAVTLGGVATFSAQPIFSSLTASSAVATDASKGLVSVTNTGTGNNVLATTPTIATPSISSPTISDGTANGVAYLNGSKVLTTGSALVFDGANLGVGTTSPVRRLEVSTTSTGTVNLIGLGTSGAGGQGMLLGVDTTNSYAFIKNNTSASYGLAFFSGNGSEAARFDSSGNLLVGTTSTAAFIDTKFWLSGDSGTTKWGVGPRAALGTAFYVVGQTGSAGVYLPNTAATSWSSASDERLKTEIIPFENAAQKVCSLRAGTGRYLTDDETVSRSFLVAQDVQAVLPEAVTALPDEMGTLGLAYTEVIPLLVAAIKEQQTIITTLTDRITALEARNG